MKTLVLITLSCLAASLCVFGAEKGGAVAGGDAVLQDARISLQGSLPYIEKTSAEWMAEKKCDSCHVVAFDVWAHVAAAAKGLAVDSGKLASSASWALADALSDRRWSGFRSQILLNLKTAGTSDDVLTKLKPLQGKNFPKEKDLLETLEKTLGKETFEKEKELLVREAKLPNNGGGPDTLAQLLLALAPQRKEEAIKSSYDAIRSLLLEWQELDGSWRAQGQLPAIKWEGEKEMNDATTMWSVLALAADDSSEEVIVRSRERALEYLKTVSPGKTVQTLALCLMVERKFGEPQRANALLEELLGGQNADGGWGWWKEYKTSDAFSTGQALYALGVIGRNTQDPAVQKALQFLTSTQAQDGSWEVAQEPITSRPGKLNVFNFWGTAWAAIGMAQVLPAETTTAAAVR